MEQEGAATINCVCVGGGGGTECKSTLDKSGKSCLLRSTPSPIIMTEFYKVPGLKNNYYYDYFLSSEKKKKEVGGKKTVQPEECM